MKYKALALVSGSILCVGSIGAWGLAQPGREAPPATDNAPDFGEILRKGLNESEGCLKVIFADTSVGTNTIIAWFENKAAVETWYYSATHTQFMRMIGTDPSTKKPMAHIKDEDIPVMVMASITFGSAEDQVIPGPIPASQISIELYTPLDAGASVNGRLMPESIQLEHFNAVDVYATQGG
jgi:hypothetical protein